MATTSAKDKTLVSGTNPNIPIPAFPVTGGGDVAPASLVFRRCGNCLPLKRFLLSRCEFETFTDVGCLTILESGRQQVDDGPVRAVTLAMVSDWAASKRQTRRSIEAEGIVLAKCANPQCATSSKIIDSAASIVFTKAICRVGRLRARVLSNTSGCARSALILIGLSIASARVW